MNSSSDKLTLSLLIPGILGPDYTGKEREPDIPAMPVLERLLSRSKITPCIDHGFEALAFTLFGIDYNRVTDLPVAPVTRIVDKDNLGDEWCMRADPVYLQADKDCLRLVDGRQLRLSQQEADALAAEIMENFAEDGWNLRAMTPERWYLSLPETPPVRTTPLPGVVGRNIEPFLPRGPEGKKWQALMNEIQILLHTSAVNAEREQRGELPVNSLWFWGGGILPKISRSPWAEVWGSEPLISGLARQSVTPTAELPASFQVWQQNAVTLGNHLVVMDQARSAVAYHDFDDWLPFLQGLEMNWLEDAVQAVKDNTLAEIHIYSDSGHHFCYNKSAGRRWWKRTRTITHFRQKLLKKPEAER